ncbi:hypothetical protein NHQ30_005814 [Ciborinia camelliae]|nr:hypothetical protein NHQ30_005814 [Ciborinia camelliae]
MQPSNHPNFLMDPNQQEDFRRQQYYQDRHQMQIQHFTRPNVQQQQFEQNQNHVPMHQNQLLPPLLPFQNYYSNNPPYFNPDIHTGNGNNTSTSQYSSTIQNESTLRQHPFISNPPIEGVSSQAFSGQLGDSSSSHASPANSNQVAIRPANAPRRGRPPKNLSDKVTSTPKVQKSTVPKRRGRPPKPKDTTALVNNTNPDLLTPRDQKPIHGNQPISQSDGNPPKRRGRPPKQPSPEREIPIPDPKFLVYKCEWKKCPAQLHNLATLRMHLFKIHGKRENGTSSCLWKGCTITQTVEEGDALSSDSVAILESKFKNEDDWRNHVEKEHITPYAWHMGDGPQNSIDGPKKPTPSAPAYLFDKNGVQVTPSIENQQIEEGDPKRNNAQRFRRRINGLDFVLDPMYNSEYESPIKSTRNNIQEEDQAHSGEEDGDDDENADMDIGPYI